jgi:hypothetical protein
VFSVKKLDIAVPQLTEFQQRHGRRGFSDAARTHSPGTLAQVFPAYLRLYIHAGPLNRRTGD